MNCRRVQKLIPLHVEGDLRSGIANGVASHLEWCGRCNWLADEYKESQSWLRSSPLPEFDDASLEDLKRGVLNRVAETTVRTSLFASIVQQWSRRQVLALAATFVIVLGMIALYFYQTRVKVSPDMITRSVTQPPSEESGTFNAPPAIGTGEAPGTSSSKRRHASNNLRDFRLRGGYSTIAKRAVKTPLVSQTSETTQAATVRTDQKGAPLDASNGSREMLRIEIQTGDPSIRIIWFAPKETDLQQTKPATD